ncbi:MAG TPA: hypothetical protein VGY48_15900 [Vicinamibacterales bacterium]|jgi:hypothetical protein|nr:hypothetical protein [Vicinamibacterales bacterium]
MRNRHKSRTAQALQRAINILYRVELAGGNDAADAQKAQEELKMLRDRWSSAYSNAEGCCKRWLSGINGTQER